MKHYKSGEDCMGEHKDAKSLRGTPLCTLSIGATRLIRLRPAKVRVKGESREERPAFSANVQRDLKNIVAAWRGGGPPPALSPSGKAITVSLAHGDVFVMGGSGFQTEFTHELPAEPKVMGGRVGLVIRAREAAVAQSQETGLSGSRRRAVAGEAPGERAPPKRAKR